MKISTEELLSDLIERTRQNLEKAEQLYDLDAALLNFKRNADSWSALECLEHLNYYGDFYLPEIDRRIKTSPYPADPVFKAGLFGNYFANMMLPGEKMKPIKTLKSTNPNGSRLTKASSEKFIAQQKKILELLESARSISLNRTKASISIAPVLKLKLGDTFRVVIYHNQRHIVQAEKVINSQVEDLEKEDI